MKMFCCISLFCFINYCHTQFDYTENGDPEEYSHYMNNATDLYNELFTRRNYNRYLAPIYGHLANNRNNSKVARLNVHFDLWYIKLISLDSESQVLSVCLELKMYWRDPRLAWNESKFNAVDHLFVAADVLWIPDIQIGNTKTLDSIKADANRAAQISSNGTIYFPVFYYTEVVCPIIINTFPFDRQLCPVALMSMLFDIKYLTMSVAIDPNLFAYTQNGMAESLAEISQNTAGVLLTKQFLAWGNGEWDVTNISAFQGAQGGVEALAYLLSIRRVPNFYVYVIALPCFILTALSIVGMFWTPNIKKEQLVKSSHYLYTSLLQLTIGLTSLVSMTVLLDMLSSAIPKTSVFPLLGIYVVCCVGITSLASVVITLHCLPNPKKHHEQQNEKMVAKEDLKQSVSSSFSVTRCVSGILHRNIFLLLFFQALNLVGFIVFLSFWN